MKRLLPVLMGFALLLLSSTKGWSLPPCPGSPTSIFSTRVSWTDCFGTLTYGHGAKYVGEWKNDKHHGQGTFTYTDGTVKEGIWEGGFLKYAEKPSPRVIAKKSPTPSSIKNEKELEKPYSITLPTKAMLFYETRNINWQKSAREALKKEESQIELKILLSADEISRGVPFTVPGGKNNSCDFTIEKRTWDDPDLSQLTWGLPCVVQTFVNKTGIPNLKKTYRLSGCIQKKVLGKHHLCLKKPKEVASFYPNEGWVAIPGKPKNETTSIKKKMLRPLSPILSTDPWLRITKIAQDRCNIKPHYQIVDVRYCNNKGSCPTRPWKIAKGKPIKLPSLDKIGWNFKFPIDFIQRKQL